MVYTLLHWLNKYLDYTLHMHFDWYWIESQDYMVDRNLLHGRSNLKDNEHKVLQLQSWFQQGKLHNDRLVRCFHIQLGMVYMVLLMY